MIIQKQKRRLIKLTQGIAAVLIFTIMPNAGIVKEVVKQVLIMLLLNDNRVNIVPGNMCPVSIAVWLRDGVFFVVLIKGFLCDMVVDINKNPIFADNGSCDRDFSLD